jgi:hypothetical protein
MRTIGAGSIMNELYLPSQPVRGHYIGAPIAVTDIPVGTNIVSDSGVPLNVYPNPSMNNVPNFSSVNPGTVMGFTTDSDGSTWVEVAIPQNLIDKLTLTTELGYVLFADVQQGMSAAEAKAQSQAAKQTADANISFLDNIPSWIPWTVGAVVVVPLLVALINSSHD